MTEHSHQTSYWQQAARMTTLIKLRSSLAMKRLPLFALQTMQCTTNWSVDQMNNVDSTSASSFVEDDNQTNLNSIWDHVMQVRD